MRDEPADTQLFAQLTDKQKEVLRLIAAGFQQKEAAAQFGITVQALVERLRPVRRMSP